MSNRETQDPTRTYEDGSSYMDKGDYREEHPAFGVAVVHRVSGGGRALFQSDLLHRETIRLTVHRAERGRSLMHDWVHSKGAPLVEIELSLAQWGELLSSAGIGSGVPVTIRATETDYRVPDLPYEPRIQTVVAEAKNATNKLMERVRDSYAKVRDAFDNKKGVKAQREALDSLGHTIRNTESNAEFAVKSMVDAAEHVTSQAKADIEAHILRANAALGLRIGGTPIVPELGILEPKREPRGLEIPSAADDPRFEHGEIDADAEYDARLGDGDR